MIIIADSGSTKCRWMARDGGTTYDVQTRGINAIQQSDEEIIDRLEELPQWEKIESVWFYGAGCGEKFPATQQRIKSLLQTHFHCAHVHSLSDLEGAARALFGNGEGIACILGTGSNSCYCARGEVVENTPPLGYILGDEGSGAVLGRNLLNGVLKGHIPLQEELYTEMGINYEELICRIYRQPAANRFLASFAPFILRHMDCPEIREMLKNSFREFAKRNLSRYPSSKKVSFVGGIAEHFKDILQETMQEEGFWVEKIIGSPAPELLNYHLQENEQQ